MSTGRSCSALIFGAFLLFFRNPFSLKVGDAFIRLAAATKPSLHQRDLLCEQHMRPSSASVLFRSIRSCSRHHHHHPTPTTMKLLAPAVVALAANSAMPAFAWIPSISRTTSAAAAAATRPFSSAVVVQSIVAPEEAVPDVVVESSSSSTGVRVHAAASSAAAAALQPNGKSVAHGTVVSFFKGGLAAVKVMEDDDDDNSNSNTNTNNSQADNLIGRHVVFASGAVGMVIAQRPPVLFCYTDASSSSSSSPNSELDLKEGKVQILDSMAQVTVSDDLRMVDCFGRSMTTNNKETTNIEDDDNKNKNVTRDIFADIPQVSDIALINSPMLTGITMMDALAPIGKGQNMLFIGSCLDELRGYMTDFLSTQIKSGKTKCIYAMTHNHQEAVLDQLRAAKILDHVIVVATRTNNSHGMAVVDPVTHAAEAVAVTATACAIAESFAHHQGQNALVIVDSLDEYKVLWDATTRVLVNVFGVDAVVQDDRNGGSSSEMRAFYSSLIQRAGSFRLSKGGGSVTLALITTIPKDYDDATNDDTVIYQVSDFDEYGGRIKDRLDIVIKKKIPLTAANLKKIGIPIPSVSEAKRRLILQYVDELISMSDGQIWLDDTSNDRPPMDPQRSITRVGIGADTPSRADAPAIRRMVEGLRLDLAQAANVLLHGTEETVASSKQIRRRNAWLLAMHQEPGQGGRLLSDSCVALLAASMCALDDTIDNGGLAGTDLGKTVMQDLLSHVRSVAPEAMDEIDETLDIGVDGRQELVDAIESFVASS